jgi:hypothetical protein
MTPRLCFLPLLAIAGLVLVAGCKPKLDSGEPSARIHAVRDLTDHAVLAKIAVEDKDADVRRAAVERLTDQAALAKVAVGDKDKSIRRAAKDRLDKLRGNRSKPTPAQQEHQP